MLANENHATVRTYELNLLFTGGWLSAPFGASEPMAMANAYVKIRTDISISLPAFICWLNYICVR